MDVLKDFLISTFFEAALAFLWICPLVVAFSGKATVTTCRSDSAQSPLEIKFVESPIATIWATLKGWMSWINEKKATMPFAIIFVLFSYPTGVVMQRVSDEFIETTSIWMPKELRWESNPWFLRDCDIKDVAALVEQLNRPGDLVRPCLPEKFQRHLDEPTTDRCEMRERLARALNHVLKNETLVIKDARLTEGNPDLKVRSRVRIREKRLFLERTYRGLLEPGGGFCRRVLPVLFRTFGRDEDVKNYVWKRYRHLIDSDLQIASFTGEDRREQKIIRDTRTRRAFGREATGAYMNRLLELVRICQAAAMHLFLLFYVLVGLSLVLIVRRMQKGRGRTVVLVMCVLGMAFWNLVVPFFHDASQFNFPVFVVFLAVNSSLALAASRVFSRGAPKNLSWRTTGGLCLVACTALALCYFATFSWAEHRENYEEAVLILGGDAPPLPSKEA